MHGNLVVLSIGGPLLLGAVSPGPSFVVVARTSVARSRRHGLAVALGLGVGGVVFGVLALLGLSGLLARVEWLYVALKVLGGCYLAYLAAQLWRHATEPIAVAEEADTDSGRVARSFWLGLTTQVSNPKTAVVYGSILVALLPPDPSIVLVLTLLPTIMLVEFGWYSIVALVMSSARPRSLYLRSKSLADRLAAAVLGLLGLRLVSEAAR